MLRARQVLNDAMKASSSLEVEDDEQLRRVFWVASVVLARAALHVLDKVDAASDPTLREEVDRRWRELNDSKPVPGIFWNFLELERNLVLKQFEFAPDLEDRFLMIEGGTGFLLLEDGSKLALESFLSIKTDGPFKGRDAREVLSEALDWVDGYISLFEKSAGDCKEGATVKAAMEDPSSNREAIAKMRGSGDVKMTTDQVMKLTRG
jgi:hypothetical protein